MYPTLSKSYKNTFPFKIGSTSFIYPDGYEVNVKILAPYLNEIELLMIESSPDSLPTKRQIKRLAALANDFDISYNVHLPTDIYLGDLDPNRRQYAIDAVKRVIDLTQALSPSTYTLHLPYDEMSVAGNRLRKWQDAIYESMDRLLLIDINSETISIETLMYPFEWVETIVTSFQLSVCLDIGHLILQNVDIEGFYKSHERKISIVHLYGVNDQHEHLSLDRLSEKDMESIVEILKAFSGVVSMEVFSYDHLRASLDYLERCWFQGQR